jgi:hypothetical protein
MDAAAALISFCNSDCTIKAAIDCRLYPMTLPQNPTLPAAIYTEIDPGILHAMGGDDPMRRPTFEIECHGATSLDASTALAAFETALHNYSGSFGNLTCHAVLMDGGSEGYDPDTNTYWKSREFQFYLS